MMKFTAVARGGGGPGRGVGVVGSIMSDFK